MSKCDVINHVILMNNIEHDLTKVKTIVIIELETKNLIMHYVVTDQSSNLYPIDLSGIWNWHKASR